MANFTDEKKRLLPAEEVKPAHPETRGVLERLPNTPENKPLEELNKPTTETVAKVKELFSFKRRPKIVLPIAQDPAIQKVEKILEDGLGDSFARLSPVAQQEFKLKGEDTARKISELLKATHVKVKKIFRLILEWLRLLPGINRFFLEQEAKIKTDRIIALHQNKK